MFFKLRMAAMVAACIKKSKVGRGFFSEFEFGFSINAGYNEQSCLSNLPLFRSVIDNIRTKL